jgi:hypothetical protein
MPNLSRILNLISQITTSALFADKSMSESIRLTSRIIGPAAEARVRHYRGLPPQLTGGKDTRAEMETSALLLIKQSQDGFFAIQRMAKL